MIEIGRRLLGDRGEHAEAHQDVALGIEQHHLAFGCASARPSANPAWPPIAGSPSGTSRFGGAGQLDPITAAAAGHDDRVAAMRAEGFERLGDAHHRVGPPTG